jgi:hypothetical protein
MDKKTKVLIGVAAGLGVAAFIASVLTPTSPLYYQSIVAEVRQVIK